MSTDEIVPHCNLKKKGEYIMTTSISSVNAGSMAASESVAKQTSSLSNSTKSKLESLGIAVTDGMTESQAQAKIAQAEQSQSQQGTGQQQQNETESEVLSEAKSLASSIGIAVSSDSDVSTILDDIGAELEIMLEEAENNPGVLSQLSVYLSELTSLDSRYDTIQTAREGMYAAMDMVSTNNKLALGL